MIDDIRNCKWCGNEFIRNEKWHSYKYCSNSCNKKYYEQYRHEYNRSPKVVAKRRLKEELNKGPKHYCLICNYEISRHSKYCKKHRKENKYPIKGRHCQWCNKEISDEAPRIKKFCSDSCRSHNSQYNYKLREDKEKAKKRIKALIDSKPAFVEYPRKRRKINKKYVITHCKYCGKKILTLTEGKHKSKQFCNIKTCYNRYYMEKHKEYLNELNRNYKKKNRVKINERKRKYRANNRTKFKEKNKLYQKLGSQQVPLNIKKVFAIVHLINRILYSDLTINVKTAKKIINQVAKGETHVAYQKSF